ncbi:QRFP-like peptide receptor [Dreissena polymorpha]|uniref:G-protein coupled receptors family 1 profile domain-containing protein n=1 Tax=Dreissena polymorpha TaxID=45954 RepID=A0A9D4RNL0_DREPO|nr:QRFP-like peptide receptor [Dreissena polymorpha]KAH3872895.1 hypothetical protein DPMN_036118 [Dreissena polymorpha]
MAESFGFHNTTASHCDLANNTNITSSGNASYGFGGYHPSVLCKYAFCENRVEMNIFSICKEIYYETWRLVDSERQLSLAVPALSKVILSVLQVAIFIMSLCGNSLVVLTFIFNKHMRSVTNVFILSLAASDLTVTCTCIPLNICGLLRNVWSFGQFGCKMMPCITQFCVTCSTLTLCCIAFDRYYAIVYPLKLKVWQTTQRATVLQVVVWVTSALTSIPYAFFYETTELSSCAEFGAETKVVCKAENLRYFREVMDSWVSLPVLFIGPFIFITILYTIICYKLWMQRPIGASRKTFDGRLKLKQKAIKMLVVVVVIFATCWSPLLLFNAIAERSLMKANQLNMGVRRYLQCLAISSTCWNPLVYAFMNEKFRRAFQTLITCRKGRVHPLPARRNTACLSIESRKTTSQLEAVLPVGTEEISETKA